MKKKHNSHTKYHYTHKIVLRRGVVINITNRKTTEKKYPDTRLSNGSQLKMSEVPSSIQKIMMKKKKLCRGSVLKRFRPQ